MQPEPSALAGAAPASLACGPIFLLAYLAAALFLAVPRPIPVGVADAAMLLPVIVTSAVVGTILGLVPNLIGAALMCRLSNAFEGARLPEAWTACGAASGYGMALLLPGSPEPRVAFALTATSAFCAWICWRFSGPRDSDRRRT
jgi:hypothetical protein